MDFLVSIIGKRIYTNIFQCRKRVIGIRRRTGTDEIVRMEDIYSIMYVKTVISSDETAKWDGC